MANRSSGLAAKVKGRVSPKKKRNIPLWKGPSDPEGGVTQSLLGRYLACRERFRLKVVEGLSTDEGFQARMEYGNLWHVCEEELAKHKRLAKGARPWEAPLLAYAKELAKRFKTQQDQVNHWYNVCKVQFPIYVDYWKNHVDVKTRTPLLEEVEFRIPYLLPSGRVVWLKGKWDSVDVMKDPKTKKTTLVLQENKSKTSPNQQQISRQLLFDIQTGTYLTALDQLCGYAEHGVPAAIEDYAEDILPSAEHWGNLEYGDLAIRPRTIRYNVIRRPLSGGKGSIKQKQGSKNVPPETAKEFYERLHDVITEDVNSKDQTYFHRWEVKITDKDLQIFKQQFLHPCLENLCDWWEYMQQCDYKPWSSSTPNHNHWRHPFGVYNSVNETGYGDMDEYLLSGSTVGLKTIDNLFPELSI